MTGRFSQNVTNKQERIFEKNHILSQQDYYLRTDVMDKIANDSGYRSKVEYIECHIKDITGWILDIGSNTSGESEYLVTRGYSMIASDINEYALGLSSRRCKKFGRTAPRYCAFDAENIPLPDNSISCVVINETLHHVEDPIIVLSEANRVLKSGGRLFLYEPYAYNPYRRLSEIRDKYRGTIEKSFSIKQILKILALSKFAIVSIERHVEKASLYKLKRLPYYRRLLRVFYKKVSNIFPRVFGNITVVARKPGDLENLDSENGFDDLLRCPISGAQLFKCAEGYVSSDKDNKYIYPLHDGIPVLIKDEAILLDNDKWTELMSPSKAHD